MAEAAFLYVIGEAEGPHKVGLSAKPRRRLSELQCSTHRPLLIKKTSATAVRDAAAIEAWAHHFMFAHRLRGEWFAVSADEAWKHLHAAEMAVLCGRPTPRKMPSSGAVGRPMLYPDKIIAPLPPGSLKRIAAVLMDGEDKTDLLREAVARELDRREASFGKPVATPPAGD